MCWGSLGLLKSLQLPAGLVQWKIIARVSLFSFQEEYNAHSKNLSCTSGDDGVDDPETLQVNKTSSSRPDGLSQINDPEVPKSH